MALLNLPNRPAAQVAMAEKAKHLVKQPRSTSAQAARLERLCEAFEDLTEQARQAMAENPGFMEEAVRTKEASRIVQESEATLANKRSRGGGCVYGTYGGLIYYRRRDLFEYLAKGIRKNTSQ